MQYRDIAIRATDDALENVGVKEKSENWSPFIKLYLQSVGIEFPAPWCCAFVYFRLLKAANEAGEELEDYPRSGYVPDVLNWAKKHDRFVSAETVKAGKYKPKKGDLVLFYFKELGRVAHVGFVENFGSVNSVFKTCEGNTSDESNVNREGDGVYNRNRKMINIGIYGGFVNMD
jgi:hypothetical protein